ncbi:hypothetical protein Tco_0836222 [Tanacetum coccineum]
MTTAGTRAVLSTNKGKVDNALKKSRWAIKKHSTRSCSVIVLLNHILGNKAYLSDYEDYNGGFVAFGSDPKGGKITGKGKIRTANLDFDDVYFVDELKFNLFSVSQMCDKKNSVLFTDTECLILSPSFKLLDESQVVLRAPRQNDVYSLDLKNIVPSGDKDVQVFRIMCDKKEQHTLTEAEQALKDDLERMIAQEIAAKAMDDATRQAFEEEKKRAAQATSINKLNTGRPSVSTSNSPLVSTANTPYASAASTPTGANTGGSSFVYLGGQIPIDASTLPNADLPIDPNMPDLEDDSDVFPNDGIFSGAYDDEDVGAEADFNNMDNTIDVSPIPTLRVHKDHPKGQILGDPKSAVQTRGKIQKASSVQQALTISQALEDESWVEAMQEELLQFKLQKVWILVDLPFGKKAIGTKWVFRNKRDERRLRQSGFVDQDIEVPQPQGPTITLVADEATTTSVGVETKGAATTTSGLDAGMYSGNIHESPLKSHEAPLLKLEKELKETKQTLGNDVLTLVKKAKSLEVALKRMSKRVILSDSEDEETENQGRKIQDIDDDPLVSLVRRIYERE